MCLRRLCLKNILWQDTQHPIDYPRMDATYKWIYMQGHGAASNTFTSTFFFSLIKWSGTEIYYGSMAKNLIGNKSTMQVENKLQQECIPVGCIPLACWPYPVLLGGRGRGRGVCLGWCLTGGVWPKIGWGTHPPVDRILDTPLWKLLLRAVNIIINQTRSLDP